MCAQSCLASRILSANGAHVPPLLSDKGTNSVRVSWHFNSDQKHASEATVLISPTYRAFSCTAGQSV